MFPEEKKQFVTIDGYYYWDRDPEFTFSSLYGYDEERAKITNFLDEYFPYQIVVEKKVSADFITNLKLEGYMTGYMRFNGKVYYYFTHESDRTYFILNF